MKNNLLKLKSLIVSNVLLGFIVVILLFMHYNIPSKVLMAFDSNQSINQTINQIDTIQPEKTYLLSYFDFHYKTETQNPKIIMLGNSIIRHANWVDLLVRKDVINRGISGDNLSGMCDRLKYLKDKNAKIFSFEHNAKKLCRYTKN